VLLTDITSLGKNAGLDIRAFRPQAEVRRDFYAEVPIDIEFVGRFHDMATFFDRVARLPRIVNIGRLDITIARQTGTETVLAVKGNATTFRFAEAEATSGDVTAPAARGARRGKR
jgi:type IV pilus assembly protein PilO